ncbi:hypothetical protein [Agarilytica rhodophyticola]|uniref:hypothetical protein n=1 Tax=Agarilytica rhodophyticola TaxID=1737490 RepID=UPI000B345B0E|nr:hypothetical protein [Agarilytica rhodophyticola]
MKYKYFCQSHADRMIECEGIAMRAWTDTMRRGMKAYIECRSETAYVYLHSSMEIGLLRYKCKKNQFFNNTHIIKPLEFLIELLLVENNFNEAIVLLSKMSNAINDSSDRSIEEFDNVYERYYKRIETCEKQYFSDAKYNTEKHIPHSFQHENISCVH